MSSSSNNNRLFVYGTLREAFDNPMADLLQTYTEKMGLATFQGKLFYVQSHPATIPSDDESDIVKGELYEMKRPDKLLQKLDHYEGYDPDHPERSLYLREEVMVSFGDEEISSWIYLFNRSTKQASQIEHGDIIQYLREQ